LKVVSLKKNEHICTMNIYHSSYIVYIFFTPSVVFCQNYSLLEYLYFTGI